MAYGSNGLNFTPGNGIIGGNLGISYWNRFTPRLQPVPFENPNCVAEKEPILLLDPIIIADIVGSYGVPIGYTNFSQQNKMIFGDGITPNKIYLGGDRAYNQGIVAPKNPPICDDEASPIGTIRPIATICGPNTDPIKGANTQCPSGIETLYLVCAQTWVDSTGTTHNLASDGYPTYICNSYQALNEQTTDDISYVRLAGNLNPNRLRVRIDNPGFIPTVDTGHNIHFRARVLVGGGNPVGAGVALTLSVILTQGLSTIVKQVDYAYSDLNGNFQDFTIALSEAEAALITDYTNLHVSWTLVDTPSGGVNYYLVDISYAYMDIPTDGVEVPVGDIGVIYTYYRSTTQCESGPSPELEFSHATTGGILISGIEISEDPTVDFINIYKTPRGAGGFFLIKTIPNVAGSDGFAPVQEDLQGDDVALELGQEIDVSTKRVYAEGLPERCKYFANYANRVWSTGAWIDADYIAGLASFTFGSTVVLGEGTHWTSIMKGRSIGPDGAAQRYIIADVLDETTIIITDEFAESTIENSTYTVKDNLRNSNAVYFTELPPIPFSNVVGGGPEDQPADNFISIDGDIGDNTGLAVLNRILYVFTYNSIYAINGLTTNFQIYPIYKGVGCVGGHTIIEKGDYIIFRDVSGWYLFNGTTPVPISSPDSAGDAILGINRDVKRINQSLNHIGTGYYNEKDRIFHNFCAQDGAVENNVSLNWDSAVKSWSKDDAPGVFCSTQVLDDSNDKIYLMGTVSGEILQADIGHCDGAFEGTLVALVSESTDQLITCEDAHFDVAEGLVGVPAMLIDPYGYAYKFRIINNTINTVQPVYPLPFIPDNTYTLIIGYIDFLPGSGDITFDTSRYPTVLQNVIVSHDIENCGILQLMVGKNLEALEYQEQVISLDEVSGLSRIDVGTQGRFTRFQLRDPVPGHPVVISDITLNILMQREAQG